MLTNHKGRHDEHRGAREGRRAIHNASGELGSGYLRAAGALTTLL